MSTFTDWNGPQGQQARAMDLIQLADAYSQLVTKLNAHIERGTENNVHNSKDYIDDVKQDILEHHIPSITGLLTKLEAEQTYQSKATAVKQSDIQTALAGYATEESVNNKLATALTGNATQQYVQNQLQAYIRSDSLQTHAVISDIRTSISAIESWITTHGSESPTITTQNITDFTTAVERLIEASPALGEALSTIDSKIETGVRAERDRAQAKENAHDTAIEALQNTAVTEANARAAADQDIREDLGNKANLETRNKNNIVSAINEINNKLQEQVTVDPELDPESSNPVRNEAIVEGIKRAGAKVGATMFWPSYDVENRVTRSQNPFTFVFKGLVKSVTVPNGTAQLEISNNVPLDWHALDGKAELNASEYPELAAFMPDNVTTNGKIWLPYVAKTIIKVK